MKVLRERDAMVAKTAADNKKAAEQFEAAQADYEEAMKEARVQASSLRDNARAEGRKVVEDARAGAEQQVMSTLQMAAEQLKRERDAVELDLRANVGTMSATLASRILGVEVATRRGHVRIREVRTVIAMSTFIGQLVGFAAIVLLVVRYVVPPVRRLMAARQDTVRQQLKDAATAADRLTESHHGPQQGRGSRQVGGRTGRRRGPDGRRTHRRTVAGPGRCRRRTHQGRRAAARSSCCGHS